MQNLHQFYVFLYPIFRFTKQCVALKLDAAPQLVLAIIWVGFL